MLTPEGLVTILVALIALVGTIFNTLSNRGKMSRDDAVSLEHRLTALEQNMFTQEDRSCLTILNERVDNILTTLATMIPVNLKNPPGRMDMILEDLSAKAASSGWAAVVDFVRTDLSAEDRGDLLLYLETQSKHRSKQRRLWAGLYLGMLKLELETDDGAVCEV